MVHRHPFLDRATPIVIGHRGCAGEVAENTLLSFERGLADGAAILESAVAELGLDGFTVSDWGLREGVILESLGLVPALGERATR